MASMTPLIALLIDHTCHTIIPLLVPLLVLPLSLINATFSAVDNVFQVLEMDWIRDAMMMQLK